MKDKLNQASVDDVKEYREKNALKWLVNDIWRLVLDYLDELTLLRVSEINHAMYRNITRDLFVTEVCVVCGALFCALDNRRISCIKIHNRKSRRHKPKRNASDRELRRLDTLIANRKRINAKNWKPFIDDASKEECILCSRKYLPYAVHDSEWQALIPPSLQSETLCISCFLKSGRPSNSILSSIPLSFLLLGAALLLFTWLLEIYS